mgnify:CR=1 FL=1
MAKKIVTWIKASDYDKLQKLDEIEITVEAKNRKPMTILARVGSLKDNDKEYPNYENAIFNGEYH